MQTILLSKTDRLADALDVPKGITSIVGGGGKTTAMLRLARELHAFGARVIMTTTTLIFPPEGIVALTGANVSDLNDALSRDRLVCLGTRAEHGKLAAPPVAISELTQFADYVLIEADGAKQLPVKAPAAHEPVIPEETKLVVAVAGLDSLGRTVENAAFRPALFAALIGTDEAHRLTAGDLARVLTHEGGQRKGVRAGMRYCVLLNKADDEATLRAALEIPLSLEQEQVERVVIAALGYNEKERIQAVR